jgi:hypothetical protein
MAVLAGSVATAEVDVTRVVTKATGTTTTKAGGGELLSSEKQPMGPKFGKRVDKSTG